ncbi:MAG: 23S rRNA (adenine(2503)-C(2))-methyltransferase RlmN [bacterium]
MEALIGLELHELEELLGATEPRYRARQLYTALYRERRSDLHEVLTLPASLRERLAGRYTVGVPGIERRFDSADGTRRYLLRLADGRTVESVTMPEEGRQTICISTQVGCPVACRFCLTARLGLERNLTAGEIAGEVLAIAADNGLKIEGERVNVVMMGQGEPLLNLENVLKATRILLDPAGVGLSPRRMTLSTAGIIPGIDALGRERVRPKLAISLNASTEEQRRVLMPVTRKYHLADLIEACRRFPLRPWERLTFEYVMLKGVNDSDADARRVVRLLAHLKCKVNLIPLNPGPDIPYEPPEPERVAAFQEIVKRSVPCFVRKPRGRDVFAACGQLSRMSGG